MKTRDRPKLKDGRLVWLDQLKLIAALLMVADHTLYYFGGVDVWSAVIRMTLTRAAQPLYAFCFCYLLLRNGDQISWKRYGQIALASICVSGLYSAKCGSIRLDMLATILAVAPCLPWLFQRSLLVRRSIFPVCCCLGCFEEPSRWWNWDYSPLLLLAQAIISLEYVRRGVRPATTMIVAGFLVALGSCTLAGLFEIEVSANALVLIAGHPLAAAMIAGTRWSKCGVSGRQIPIRSPLTFYAGHLVVLHVLSAITA